MNIILLCSFKERLGHRYKEDRKKPKRVSRVTLSRVTCMNAWAFARGKSTSCNAMERVNGDLELERQNKVIRTTEKYDIDTTKTSDNESYPLQSVFIYIPLTTLHTHPKPDLSTMQSHPNQFYNISSHPSI